MQEVECGSHFANASVVASHVVECHGLSQFVVLAQLLTLFEQVQSTVDVLLLQVVDGEDVADFAQLLARACEFSRRSSKMNFFDLQKLL